MTDGVLYWFGRKARGMAGIMADAPLRDQRHVYASHAVTIGMNLHVTERLLRHRRASRTNRHIHLDDATLSQYELHGRSMNGNLCIADVESNSSIRLKNLHLRTQGTYPGSTE